MVAAAPKGRLPSPGVAVACKHYAGCRTAVPQDTSFGQPLTDAQKEWLLWIAVNCPVAKLLQGEIHINTHLSDDPTVSAGMGNYPPSDVASVDATMNYTTQ